MTVRAYVIGLVLALTSGLAPGAAPAQMCERPLCDSDETYAPRVSSDGRSYGVCESGPAFFPPLAESHRIASCPSGWTLNLRTGQCVDDGCRGGCGQTRPVCPSDATLDGQGVDRTGRPYAMCREESGPGYVSRTRTYCREGWRLIAGGMCQKECAPVRDPVEVRRPGAVFEPGPIVSPTAPEVVRRPDLVIKNAYLRASSSSAPLDVLIAGQSYLACFTVANQGNDSSGPFRVGGGGLGVATGPYQNQTALADGAVRDGCLNYPTTPGPGNYTLGLTVDLRNTVRESREDNNTYDLRVRVESLVREPKRALPPLEPPVGLPRGKLPVKPGEKP